MILEPLTTPRRLRPFVAEATFIKRSLLHSVRNADVLVMAIVLPTMLMLLFTFVFGGALASDGSYVNYVVPGIILLCAGFGAASVAVDVSNDMTTGIIDRFRTMPIPAGAVLAGHVIASVVRNLFATAVVVAVALLVGFRPTASFTDWLAALAVVAVYILAITWLFAAIGLAASSPEAASGYGFILLFLPYLSSAFVPVDTLPSWLQWVAQNQPITPIIETIRGLLLGTPIGDSVWLALGWCGLILAFSITWGAILFGRRTARS